MKLKELVKNLEIRHFNAQENIEVENISISSKNLENNSIFICIKGVNTDGHNYVDDAIKNGCVLVVSEKKLSNEIPHIVVSDTRKAFSILASNFYGNPSKKLKLIGITGTNGKTTTSYLIKSILQTNGKKVGVIGTLGYQLEDKNYDLSLTTPDPMELNKIFYEMVNAKCEYCVMEVSAHAIALNKIFGLEFEVACFTNLSQDHLDFFKDMKTYGDVKKSFFNKTYTKCAVVNTDDDIGREIFISQNIPTVSYALYNPSDVFAINITQKLSGSNFTLNLFDNVIDVKTNLVGTYNIYNSLCAITVCAVLGLKTEEIKKGIGSCKGVEGRFEVIKYKGIYIVIDFAHTPDGLSNVLKTAKSLCKGKVISVFGCGGSRDATKRPIMAREAEKYSDITIVTSDNPRYENPEIIIDDINKGFITNNHIGISKRKEAINAGINMCRKGDCLVICGKGGEKYQDINGVKTPYTDKEEIYKILKGFKNAK